jgi:hypothetical protein
MEAGEVNLFRLQRPTDATAKPKRIMLDGSGTVSETMSSLGALLGAGKFLNRKSNV